MRSPPNDAKVAPGNERQIAHGNGSQVGLLALQQAAAPGLLRVSPYPLIASEGHDRCHDRTGNGQPMSFEVPFRHPHLNEDVCRIRRRSRTRPSTLWVKLSAWPPRRHGWRVAPRRQAWCPARGRKRDLREIRPVAAAGERHHVICAGGVVDPAYDEAGRSPRALEAGRESPAFRWSGGWRVDILTIATDVDVAATSTGQADQKASSPRPAPGMNWCASASPRGPGPVQPVEFARATGGVTRVIGFAGGHRRNWSRQATQ